MSRRRHPILSALRLAGERIVLRAPTPDDVEPAFRLLHRRQEILRWLVWDGPDEPSDLEDHYGRWCLSSDDACDYRLVVCDRATGELAGGLGLRFSGHPGTGDLGYWIGSPFQMRGFGSEAVHLAVGLAFRHLGADALAARVFPGNDTSLRILERNGFLAVGQDAEGADRHRALLRADWERRGEPWGPSEERVLLRAGRKGVPGNPPDRRPS